MTEPLESGVAGLEGAARLPEGGRLPTKSG